MATMHYTKAEDILDSEGMQDLDEAVGHLEAETGH